VKKFQRLQFSSPHHSRKVSISLLYILLIIRQIDFGERFYTGAIFLELDSVASPICSFYGELFMRMQEEKEDPIKFTLVLGVDPFKGSLGL